MDRPKVIVTGDRGTTRYVYIDSLPDQEANLREAWVDAQDFVTLEFPGGAADLARCLGCECISRQADMPDEPLLESIYLLTNPPENDGDQPNRKPWKVGLAIVAGQRQVTFEELDPQELPDGVPLAVMDFHQGWVNSNREHLAQLLAGRPYLIRTHDPVSMIGAGRDIGADFWRNFSDEVHTPGVWFSPWQDMADGGLRVAGNWRTVCDTIIAYLKRDGGDGLCDDAGRWQHHIVIQISYDGALVLSPPDNETILRFPCDQPESFKKRRLGTVVGGGICIAASLAEALCQDLTHDALVSKARLGLARARALVKSGYSQPPPMRRRGRTPPEHWNPFPDHVLARPSHVDLPVNRTDIEGSIDRALSIITADHNTFERLMVYRMGKLYTCDETFAEQLIRLEERIQSHLNSDDEDVMSFAVLGSPGSGKSFVARQILETVGGNLQEKEVNVSQFTSEDLLVDALRQVQAISLQGNVPFVLWDEFDCVHNGHVGGWLSRFLMPMEDARFWDGAERAQLGKCVFVFVGSAWSTRQEFENWVEMSAGADEPHGPPAQPATPQRSVPPGLKGSDFQSRLDRVIEVPSVTIPPHDDAIESCSLLTRALMIRIMLGDRDIKWLDSDVAEFLLTADLRHGMRSLRAIIDASQLSRTDRFSAFHLPPTEVMDVHVSPPGHDGVPSDQIKPLRLQWSRRDLRVGVTGHRFLAEVEKLRASTRRALDEIEAWFDDRELVLISSLAEGSDRLVARAALERDAQFIATLPLPKDDYMTDFQNEESKQEFQDLLDRAAEIIELRQADDREAAYEQGGEYVLAESDAIIAIWDGQPAQDRGGTGDIAQRALDRGMPLLHIKAGNRKPGTKTPTSLGDQQGELTIYNL